MLADFVPIVAFVVAYKLWNMYVATAVLMGGCCVVLFFHFLRKKKALPLHMIGCGIVLVFGSATLFFHNPIFIQWKPTVVYWLLSTGLSISTIFFDRNIVRYLFDQGKNEIVLPEKIWHHLNVSYISLFFLLGWLNLFVAYSFSERAWVNFKLYGLFGILFFVLLLQFLYIRKYLDATKDAATPQHSSAQKEEGTEGEEDTCMPVDHLREAIEKKLQAVFQPTLLTVVNTSAAHEGHLALTSGAGHFSLSISSPTFTHLSRVQAHRLIYDALAEMIPDKIHALAISIVQ